MAFYNDLLIHKEEWIDFFSHWSHCDYVKWSMPSSSRID